MGRGARHFASDQPSPTCLPFLYVPPPTNPLQQNTLCLLRFQAIPSTTAPFLLFGGKQHINYMACCFVDMSRLGVGRMVTHEHHLVLGHPWHWFGWTEPSYSAFNPYPGRFPTPPHTHTPCSLLPLPCVSISSSPCMPVPACHVTGTSASPSACPHLLLLTYCDIHGLLSISPATPAAASHRTFYLTACSLLHNTTFLYFIHLHFYWAGQEGFGIMFWDRWKDTLLDNIRRLAVSK